MRTFYVTDCCVAGARSKAVPALGEDRQKAFLPNDGNSQGRDGLATAFGCGYAALHCTAKAQNLRRLRKFPGPFLLTSEPRSGSPMNSRGLSEERAQPPEKKNNIGDVHPGGVTEPLVAAPPPHFDKEAKFAQAAQIFLNLRRSRSDHGR